jgi:anti-sigma-K factor RskA
MIDELPEEQRKYVERMSDEDTRAFLIWRAQERAQILVGRLGGKAPAEELLARIDHRSVTNLDVTRRVHLPNSPRCV